MLLIRDDQVEALGRAKQAAFEERMARTVGPRLAEHARLAGKGAEPALVRKGIERAARHGITEKADVEQFLNLLAQAGLQFDDAPWARKILMDTNASISHRLAAIAAKLSARGQGLG